MRLTDAEWSVLEVLWGAPRLSLKEIAAALAPATGWSKKTVFTYLSRMEAKGLVRADHGQEKPYAAAVTRESCAREARAQLRDQVYGGAAGDLIAAFLKESALSPQETARLRKMLDEMEV